MPENEDDNVPIDNDCQVDPPAVVDPAVLEPAVLEPAVLEPAAVEPAVLEPAVVEPAVLEPAVDPEAVPTEPRKTRRARVAGAAPTRRSQRLIQRENTLAALVLEQEEAASAPATTAGRGARQSPNNTQAAPAKAQRKRRRVTQATRSQLAVDGEPVWKSAKRPADPAPSDGLRRSKRKAAADAIQKAYYCIKARWAVWTD